MYTDTVDDFPLMDVSDIDRVRVEPDDNDENSGRLIAGRTAITITLTLVTLPCFVGVAKDLGIFLFAVAS